MIIFRSIVRNKTSTSGSGSTIHYYSNNIVGHAYSRKGNNNNNNNRFVFMSSSPKQRVYQQVNHTLNALTAQLSTYVCPITTNDDRISDDADDMNDTSPIMAKVSAVTVSSTIQHEQKMKKKKKKHDLSNEKLIQLLDDGANNDRNSNNQQRLCYGGELCIPTTQASFKTTGRFERKFPLSNSNFTFVSQRLYSTVNNNKTTKHSIFAARNDTFQFDRPWYCKQKRSKSVFVSKHNQSMNLTSRDIIEYLQTNGIINSNNNGSSSSVHKGNSETRTTATHVIVRECPFCTNPTNGKADNMYKLYISNTNGLYFCHRCGANGSWYDFKYRLSGSNHHNPQQHDQQKSSSLLSSSSSSSKPTTNSSSMHNQSSTSDIQDYYDRRRGASTAGSKTMCQALPMPPKRLQSIYTSDLLDGTTSCSSNREDDSSNTNSCLDYLIHERGLDQNTLRIYGVGRAFYKFPSQTKDGTWIDAECVTFPWILNVSAIEYQESLRGAKFDWEPPPKVVRVVADSATTDTVGNPPSDATDTNASKKKKKGKPRRSDKKRAEDDDILDEEKLCEMKKSTYLTRRFKVRSIDNKAWQRMDPPGGGWGLFGYHTIPEGAKEIVLTEGEYDAMAVYQATKLPALSLPNGCRSLPVEVLPLLEDFDKIYLWMDNDAPGREGAEQFAKKIGLERCYIVRPTKENCQFLVKPSYDDDDVDEDDEYDENYVPIPKDANEALLDGLDLFKIINDAKLIPHHHIIDFAGLRSDVLHEIMYPERYVGAPIPSLPGLTSIIKGIRRGEVTVLTGPTGSGKTTYLGQVSLDLAQQDINVLWGSFEVKNTRLAHKLLQQFAREPLPLGNPAMKSKLEIIADRFETLPLHFMKFHGGSDVDDVIDAMDYAVYVNDVEHIILDNMQFMVSRQSLKYNHFDKFDVQDIAIEKFRKFATDRNVHVTLVVHPRKEQENSNLSIASIYGSAKATQEADLVLIIQKDGQRKCIEVKKNRFNGQLGQIPLHYDTQSCRYTEQPLIAGVIQPVGESLRKQISKATAPAKGSSSTGSSDVASIDDFEIWKSI